MNLLAERIADFLMANDDADEWEVATTIAPRADTESIERLLRESDRIAKDKLLKKFDVIEWMAEHGHVGYKRQIGILKAAAKIFMNDDAESVPSVLEEKIDEIRQMAQDRYDDWASD